MKKHIKKYNCKDCPLIGLRFDFADGPEYFACTANRIANFDNKKREEFYKNARG